MAQKFYSSEWISMATGFTYTVIGNLEADAFVDDTFDPGQMSLQSTTPLIRSGLKSDFVAIPPSADKRRHIQ